MSDTAVKVENLSKRYVLGSKRNSKDGLRHQIEEWARSPWRALRNTAREMRTEPEEFWALKDVSFEIKSGEVVGIIGRNGAGKSTLLKILSRITEPTRGHIAIEGRVASLLEVGTGFHQELTGRENIFLNGSILGMSKVEIKRKFDEIVAFSEIEKFLDTPVKRYSSGMYVRLAFAVAAHLEPEILIVDEVLAVGDAAFQKKCLGKMEEVGKQGRTILFVSHHMPSVQRLCQRAIFLEKGMVKGMGPTSSMLELYFSDGNLDEGGERDVNVADQDVRIKRWEIKDVDKKTQHSVTSREVACFSILVESKIALSGANMGFVIRNLSGDLIVASNSKDDFQAPFELSPGKFLVEAKVRLPLKVGRYQLELALADDKMKLLDHWVAKPFLQILPNENSVLPEEWRGLLNESMTFSCVKL